MCQWGETATQLPPERLNTGVNKKNKPAMRFVFLFFSLRILLV